MRSGLALAVVALAGLAGCATGETATSSPSASATPDASESARPLSDHELCLTRFDDKVLRAWSSGTVGSFRAFQYSGPVAHKPLADAFPGLSPGTPGAWCATELGPETARRWVVVAGQAPVRAIDLTGPGATQRWGETVPPVIP